MKIRVYPWLKSLAVLPVSENSRLYVRVRLFEDFVRLSLTYLFGESRQRPSNAGAYDFLNSPLKEETSPGCRFSDSIH